MKRVFSLVLLLSLVRGVSTQGQAIGPGPIEGSCRIPMRVGGRQREYEWTLRRGPLSAVI